MFFLLFFLPTILAHHPLSPTPPPPGYTQNGCELGGTFRGGTRFTFASATGAPPQFLSVTWTVTCGTADEEATVIFSLLANCSGWLGLGFNEALSPPVMAQGDFIQASVQWDDNNDISATIRDGHASSNAEPSGDEVQDVFVVSADGARHVDSTFTKVTFGRTARGTPGPDAAAPHDVRLDRPVFLLAAMHNKDASFGRIHSHRGHSMRPVDIFGRWHDAERQRAFEATLDADPLAVPDVNAGAGDDDDHAGAADGSASPLDDGAARARNARLWHGTLMLIAWFALAPALSFTARFLKRLGHSWFLAHRAAAIVALVMSALGVYVIAVELNVEGGSHLRGYHGKSGAVLLSLSLAQATLGYLADKWYNPDRLSVPLWPDLVHVGLGKVLLVGAAIVEVLGIKAVEGPSFGTGIALLYATPARVLLTTWLLGQACLFLWGETKIAPATAAAAARAQDLDAVADFGQVDEATARAKDRLVVWTGLTIFVVFVVIGLLE